MKNKTKTNTLTTNNNIKSAKSHKNRINPGKWSVYNNCLMERGSYFSVLIDKALLAPIKQSGRRGHPKEYSDALILVLAELREFTGLPFRQLIGLSQCLARYTHSKLPSYATLCRRMSQLNVPSNIRIKRLPSGGGIVLLVDSTGHKVKGEGEWFRHKHGASKRRGFMKLHLTMDYETEQILSFLTTSEEVADNKVLLPLLDQKDDAIKPQLVIGDGAYDDHLLQAEIKSKHNLRLLSPPKINANFHMRVTKQKKGGMSFTMTDEPGWEIHNQYLRRIKDIGMEEWKKETGYHKRSMVENAMYRLKSAFSGKLKSRSQKNQEQEIALRISLMNLWTNHAMPLYASRAMT